MLLVLETLRGSDYRVYIIVLVILIILILGVLALLGFALFNLIKILMLKISFLEVALKLVSEVMLS